MSAFTSAQRATPGPTGPTCPKTVGPAKLVNISGSPDRPDRPDHILAGVGENESSGGGLAEKLQKLRQAGHFESRHEHTHSEKGCLWATPSVFPVGPVGAVGPDSKINTLPGPTANISGRAGRATPSALPQVGPGLGDGSSAVHYTLPDEPPPPSGPNDYGAISPEVAENPVEVRADGRATPPTLTKTDTWSAGVARLRRMRPLEGFNKAGWRRVQVGCATLLRSHGDTMRQFGWTTEDAFGVHPIACGGAVHCYGLGLLLGFGHVVALTDSGAVIETADGHRQSFTRRRAPEAVPIWTVR